MTTLRETYRGIADNALRSVGLNSFPYIPDSTVWPAAYVAAPAIDYESLAGKVLEVHFDIIVFVSAARDKNQMDLLEYMDDGGPKSIPLAIHDNPSQGLEGVNVSVVRARPLNLQEQAGYNAFGGLFECAARLT